jgi:hypothetical protein
LSICSFTFVPVICSTHTLVCFQFQRLHASFCHFVSLHNTEASHFSVLVVGASPLVVVFPRRTFWLSARALSWSSSPGGRSGCRREPSRGRLPQSLSCK